MGRAMLHNVVIVYDVYCVAESPAEAREAVKQLIVSSDPEERLAISDENALPVVHARSIRDSWKEQSPVVAADVSDADFERIKGKKTLAIFETLSETQKK